MINIAKKIVRININITQPSKFSYTHPRSEHRRKNRTKSYSFRHIQSFDKGFLLFWSKSTSNSNNLVILSRNILYHTFCRIMPDDIVSHSLFECRMQQGMNRFQCADRKFFFLNNCPVKLEYIGILYISYLSLTKSFTNIMVISIKIV